MAAESTTLPNKLPFREQLSVYCHLVGHLKAPTSLDVQYFIKSDKLLKAALPALHR